jgi:hypothetical protein
MLAEKFILALETLIRSRTYPDGSPRVASTSPHVPVKCRIEPAFRAPSRLQPIAQWTPADLLAGMRVSRAAPNSPNAHYGTGF